MVNTNCPACNSTKIFETKDKIICKNCNYIHKTKVTPKEKTDYTNFIGGIR